MGWLGLAHIAAVVVLWVGSSELIQLIFDSSMSFESPLFLTFYSTSLFSVYLVGFLICPSWRQCPRPLPTASDGTEDANHRDPGRISDLDVGLLANFPPV